MLDRRLVQRVREEISGILPEISEFRHSLHMHPEVGVDTVETRRMLLDVLNDTSFMPWDPLIGSDLIGELPGPGTRRICLRSDMDALPVHEDGNPPYKSAISGKMHACGHDGHMAMLVGAIKVLDVLKEHLPVTVRFVFQPGEEMVAAGQQMVELGACDGCEAAYAVHGWPGIPKGKLSTREGVMFAAGSSFDVKLIGKGCHGAMPEKGNNPILAAAHAVSVLAELHARVNSEDGSVVSICAFQAGESGNVIPETAVIRGTARYLNRERADEIEQAIRNAFTGAASEVGMGLEIEYIRNYDVPVVNSSRGYALIREVADRYMPEGTFLELDRPTMGNEDFAYYLQGRDGAMVFLGLGETSPPLHSPVFDFDDEVLETGILFHVLTALSH